MRRIRMAAAAVLIVVAVAGTASAQCVSYVREIFSRSSRTSLVAGPFAWSGSILAVASHQVSTQAIWVSLFNELGEPLYPNVKFPSTDNAELIDVVWTGSDFGVFYATDDHRLMLRRVSTTGELTGSAIEPLGRAHLRLGETDEMEIIWSTQHDAYVIARTVNAPARAVRLTIIERTGVVRSDDAVAIPAPDSLVRVDITGSGVLGVFYEQDGTRHIMMAPFAGGKPDDIRKVWATAGEDLVIDARANDFVLARTVTQSDGRDAIRWKIVDTAGRDVRQEARMLIGSGKDLAALSLLSRGDEIIIAYLDSREGFETQIGSYRLRRVNTAGETLADTYFAAADTTRRRAQTPHDFVWTGTAFLAVVVRDTDAGDDSFIVRLCPLKAEISGPRVMHPGNAVTFTATGDGGVPPYEYTWKWGEFNTATGPDAQIRFDAVGTYLVTLTITDGSGVSTTSTFEVTVAHPVTPRRRAVRSS